MPLFEVIGNGNRALPEQIAAIGVNIGVTLEFTVMVIVVDVAHCPAFGVKV